jgi:tetratricopeptide (TPR) repeat protein
MFRPLVNLLSCSFVALTITTCFAQTPPKSASPDTATAQRGLKLAQIGNCAEALPLLKKAMRQTTDKDMRKTIGLTAVRCAMTHNLAYDSLDFLQTLVRDFHSDPEVLYQATHAFSDLSLHTSQDLAREAPFSYQVHLLNAEALELKGNWDAAAAEYRKIIEINPFLPGIHARLGRALISKPQPTPSVIEQAKKNFEEELEIDPNNPAAEYVLGELAKDASDWSAAIHHYSRATKIDTSFAEAYLGLGSALVSSKRFADAIPPLETYEKLAPDSPSGHFQLALAYAGVGRKEDANRQAALQRQSAESLEQVKRRAADALLKQSDEGIQPAAPPQ